MATANIDVETITVEMIRDCLRQVASPDDVIVLWHKTLLGFHAIISKEIMDETFDDNGNTASTTTVDCVIFYHEAWNGGPGYNERVAAELFMTNNTDDIEPDGEMPLAQIIQAAADSIAMARHEAERRRAWILGINLGETPPSVYLAINTFRTKPDAE